MIFRLNDTISFPDPHLGDPDGFFAVGGDLSIDRLLLAYQWGIFPWYSFRDYPEPLWCCPMDRFVIFPNEIHVSHSMRSLINKHQYDVTFNQDFDGVIQGCSQLRINERGAWLGPQIIEAYTELYRQGFAASVEVWNHDGQLVGGLYGVNIARYFVGESMFSLEPSASKLALITLARYMQKAGGTLIDCQCETPHLRSMGGRHIPYDQYIRLIQER